MEKIDLVEENK